MSRHARLVFPGGDHNQRPTGLQCDCGHFLHWPGPGRDYNCERCGRDYNSAGQLLAPREQWGEETGETAADYYAGQANPERAFDDEG